ncbi:hypothetical protein M408DRAFT_173913 [Serendipita vermifera MAFF 305830]|uniref:Uncharacterized protein n=1 Tax=Serendipita vermifera MAFF 305830 TaxID=933852 RepID=A0A0C3B6S3_SERVB|nr:hypothetical protein M408DRAFT_173913 [Serendipita vermifera MAFF 305830]
MPRVACHCSVNLCLMDLHIDRFATYVTCITSQQLASAIRRLQGTKFELVCCLVPQFCSTDETYWEGLDPIWFEQQCRALSLLIEGSLDRFPHMFRNMTALEELVVSEMNNSYLRFLHQLEESSPNLHTLELQGGFPESLMYHSVLLGRLKTLSIESSFRSSLCLSRILESSSCLEKLHWDGTARSEYVNPMIPSSRSMIYIILTNSGMSVFPTVTYAHVIDLDIKFTNNRSWKFNETDLEVQMPALRTLTLEGRWGALKSIRAPGVTRLTLRRSTEPMKNRLDAVQNTSVFPSILRLDRCIGEPELVSILRRTWKDIKELHLGLSSRNDHLRRTMTDALSGNAGESILCPQLCAITILSLKPDAMHADVIEKMKQSMRDIEKGRRPFGNLDLLRCGWVQWAGRLYEGGMESWPNQEWTDFI